MLKNYRQEEEPYLEYMMTLFALDETEKYCVRMLYLSEFDGCLVTPARLLECCEKQMRMQEWYMLLRREGTLGRFFLRETEDDGPFCSRRLRLDARVLEFAAGGVRLSPAYAPYLEDWNAGQEIEPWIGDFDETVVRWWKDDAEAEFRVLCLYGEEGSGRHFLLRHSCRRQGYDLGFLDADACAGLLYGMEEAQRGRWVCGLLRELILYHMTPVLVLSERFWELDALWQQISFYCPEAIVVASEKIRLPQAQSVTYLARGPMNLTQSKHFWTEKAKAYPLEDGCDAGSMANKFHLNPGQITEILKSAENNRRKRGAKTIGMEDLTRECYEVLTMRMDKKALYVPECYGMDDLILPQKQKKQLTDVCNQVIYKHQVYEEWGFEDKMPYGKGISMAFVGAPGTGKTMAAQVVAKTLGMRLYKVNLSGVVSKYIGETEKNLDEIFEQAEKSQVILFFDEADVLFGKRSEGKDVNDKYSNLEAAFLLQKMENYDGITILATNLFQHFDEAFKRRLKTVIEFPVPGEGEREQLWRSMLPQKMPVGEIDYEYLAKQFELTGSNIRNIVVYAAFLAAGKGKIPDMEELIPAIRNEYAKLGKMLSVSDVSEYYIYLEE